MMSCVLTGLLRLRLVGLSVAARPLRSARHGPLSSMTIHPFPALVKLPRLAAQLRRGVFLGLGLLSLAPALSAQTFLTLDLPSLNAAPPHFGAIGFSHLPDGRYVYGNNNALYLQNSFGASANTAFATPPNVDPSFITVLNGTTAVVGAGQFAPTPVYQFNPSTPATPGYTSLTSLQNFSAARINATGLYVVGINGENGDSSVSYVTTGGAQQVVIDPAGTFSAGIAVDAAGNVYVGNDDNNSVYKFTQAQIQNAINTFSTLQFGDGLLVHTFANDVVGSLAVDAAGRIWAAGFGADGLYWFNPSTSLDGVITPEAPGGAYSVNTFSDGVSDYVGYVWQSGFSNGSQVIYGYNTVQNVPEPATAALVAAAAAALALGWHRRRA